MRVIYLEDNELKELAILAENKRDLFNHLFWSEKSSLARLKDVTNETVKENMRDSIKANESKLEFWSKILEKLS